jgi:hypothetical protein
LTEAEYLVGSIATSANVVISKIHYNPAGTTDLEEFIEVMNIGPTAVDLTNCQFTLGVQFQFPDNYTLASGARALIVRDQTAFLAAYGNGLASLIAGVFTNSTSLDNGGERIQFLDALSQPIKDFSYDDENGWPTAPDGEGPSLVLIRPLTNPDPSNPANWRSSSGSSGSPGVDDSLTYDAWAAANNVTDLTGTADDDGDGLPSIAEYALGSNPKVVSVDAIPIQGEEIINVSGGVATYITLTYTRPIGRDDVSYFVEAASELGTWVPAVQVNPPTYNTGGTETLEFRYPQPMSAQSQQFLRLRVVRQ